MEAAALRRDDEEIGVAVRQEHGRHPRMGLACSSNEHAH
ncbi:hypothetical protein SNL152K_3553 [Streptomyces sp. NL15-2K]|nr:hypothetical protein SNL152K_3553 [Streptomyces sp. NL15-2K]